MIPNPSPETIDSVIGIVALFTGPRRIDLRASLRDDLGLDDIDRMAIGVELSEAFGSDVRDKEIEDWDTIEDIARTVEAMNRSKAA
ncbi:acyl carrier protein [Novosphingobium sp. KN65.2]|uniref:acyl carrier protein n=1 Tax=Novosphingobium sp. KN65.2 TaxID=1478134 RepID=UPI0005E388E4|nr:acyl carrier protein [Novosphingobium sp. KN65.2]CDO35031.1 putative Acyl carrier protein [Novosphingobium sp. KN65.2]